MKTQIRSLGWLLILLAVPVFAYAQKTPVSAITYPQYPQTSLDNGRIRLHFYLPDAEKGYYRGTRFDWSGVIRRVEFGEHQYYGEWKTTHDPSNHDDIPGPVDEFGMHSPLGYTAAKVRGTFTKIGVGNLVKKTSGAYSFGEKYTIAQAGTWTVQSGTDWIEFVQEFDSGNGWAYRYVKRIELEPDQPRFRILRTLKNTGTQPIDTDQYNHNFTVIDDEAIGTAYELTFPFPVKAPQGFSSIAKVQDNKIVFVKNLTSGSIQSEVQGFGDQAKDNVIVIYNKKSDAGVRIEGDRPLAKINYWSTQWATCPEPFVRIEAAPGEELQWSATYTFFTSASINWKNWANPR